MTALPHRIRRQRWRVQARSPEEAFILRQRLREEWEGTLLPAFERAFSEAAPGEDVVHLPRLEFHVRLEGVEALGEQLPELLCQQLREQLSQVVRGSGPSRAPSSAEARGVAAMRAGPGGATPTSGRHSLSQMRAHYLETGSLPWPLAGLERAQLLEQLRPTASEALASVRERPAPQHGLDMGEVAFYFRLLQLLPEEEWTLVARGAAAGQWGSELARAIEALVGPVASPPTRDARLWLAAALLAASRTGPERASAGQLRLLLARVLGEQTAQTPEALTSRLPEPTAALFRRWLARAEDSAASAEGAGPEGAGALANPGSSRAAGGRAGPEQRPQPARAGEARSGPAWGTLQEARDTGEGRAGAESPSLQVSHAGLLLLHPFLARFFESTGIKQAGRAELSPERLPRAAALLHLLAVGGGEEVHEFELGFIKLLLGLRPEAHLPLASGLLQPEDLEEAEALLKAVIEYWKALKSTSVQGLRASFLRRRGFVLEQDQGLRLQVEPASFDILLGALPWGIGTVKLPWMKKPIFTEWPTH